MTESKTVVSGMIADEASLSEIAQRMSVIRVVGPYGSFKPMKDVFVKDLKDNLAKNGYSNDLIKDV
jgi:hypothetical protein